MPDLELVNPHRKSVAAGHCERALLNNLHPHASQDGQQLTQGRRTAAEVPGEECLPGGVAGLKLQQHRIGVQRFNDPDVGECLVRADHLLECLGQRIGVVLGDPGLDGPRRH